MRTTPTRPKGAPQHRKIVKSLNSIEFEEWSFCDKTSDSIEFVQCQTVAQPLPDPCQPHVAARRVHLRQTVAQSMSAAWCCSQSASQPNHCPIHVSRMMSLRVCISQTIARSTSATCVLSDLCQPHSVIRRVVRSMSATWCRSQCCPIYVSRMMLFAKCVSAKPLPNPCQSHDVAQSVYQPNHCPIYISRMMLFAECVSAKLLPDLRQPYSVARSVV